jgi:hypothetical protein
MQKLVSARRTPCLVATAIEGYVSVSVTRKSLTVAAVTVTALAVTGTAVGATRYVITSLSQISPSVVKQLHGAAGPRGPAGPAGSAGHSDAFVANGSVATVNSAATTVVTLPLTKVPALVTASVTITNGDAVLDDTATCDLKLDGKDVAPPSTLDIAGETTPVNGPQTTSTTFAAALTAPGTLTLTCLDPNGSGALSAQGNIVAMTVGTVTSVAQPSASVSPTASATATPSASASPTPSAPAGGLPLG